MNRSSVDRTAVDPAAVEAAVNDAAAGAEAAGVAIAPASTPDELDVLRATIDAVWGPAIVPPRNLLRGMALGGACLLVATDAGRSPVGFALGWLGWEGGPHLHSHQVGVTGEARGRGVGLALKLAQRSLALAHGVTEMRWTFDPLLAANARFNLVRLGARVIAFHPHCYGDRTDAFNTGDRTDRLEVSWRLDTPIGSTATPVGPGSVPIPADHQALRRTDPAAADAERLRVGTALAELFDGGGTVLGLSADGTAYVTGPRP